MIRMNCSGVKRVECDAKPILYEATEICYTYIVLKGLMRCEN